MTNEPNPRPWRVEQNVVGWHSFIVDANGDGVAACWRTARGDDEKERQYNEANAALIVDAVNKYDRLRDLVRRLVSSLSVHHSATMAAVMSNREEFDTSDFRKDIDADAALLREARAAIGEGAR